MNFRATRTLFCLALVVAAGLPGSALLPRQSATVDISVDEESLMADPPHPKIGELTRLSASIRNNADYDTSVVDIFFWEGDPVPEHLIGSDQISIGPGETNTATQLWNTSSFHSGFYNIWVTASPTDFTDPDLSNNNASRWFVLSGPFSWIVDETEETYSGPKIFSDIIGIWDVGRLTLQNSTIYIPQERDHQFGILIDDHSELTLRRTTIGSDHDLIILVQGSGRLVVEPGCNISADIFARDKISVSVENSTLSGGIASKGGNVTITNSTLLGGFSFRATTVVFRSDTFTTNRTLSFAACNLTAEDTTFDLAGGVPYAGLDTLNVTAGTAARLTGVVSGKINVQGFGSIVLIFRYLTMHARDTIGRAVQNATLEAANLFNWEPPQCRTTNDRGDAPFTVITDVLLPGSGKTEAKAVGSYNVTGIKNKARAQTNVQLPYYPTMTAESNHPLRNITFYMVPHVELVSPVNNSAVNTTTIRLAWTAADPDGDPLTFEVRYSPGPLDTAPVTTCITASEYLDISNLADNTTYYWTVSADDGSGFQTDVPVGIWSFTVRLPPVNRPPRMTGVPATTVTAGNLFQYNLTAVDEDFDVLRYSLVAGPPGMSIDNATGRLRWQTTISDIGNHTITIRVMDTAGATDNQTFNISVLPPPPPPKKPKCAITAPPNNSRLSGRILVRGTALNGSLPLTAVQVRLDGGPWQTAAGLGNWSMSIDLPGQPNGRHTIEARAFDGSLYSDLSSVQITVKNREPGTTLDGTPWPGIALVVVILAAAGIYLALRGRRS